NVRVVLFKTRFALPAAEEQFAAATAAARAGQLAQAEQSLERALALDGNSAEFWLLKVELLGVRGANQEAIAAIEQTLALAPAANRAAIASTAATAFYRRGAIAGAVQLYRASLALRY